MSFGHDIRTRKYSELVPGEADEDSDVTLKVFIPTPTNNGHTHQVIAESELMENGAASEGESTDGEVIYSKAEDKVSLIKPKSKSKSKSQDQDDNEDIDKDGVVREYEVALQHIGFGLFHIILVICNGLALSSDAVEVLSISFVLPVIGRRDELWLHDWQTALLSSVIFIGMLFGSYFWGGLADMIGRKKTLVISLAVSGVFGLVSAFSPNYVVFIFLRFFSGFGVGGSLPVLFPYISEFICNKYRGPYLGVQSTFWMVGRLLCGALAWIIIPQTGIDFSLGLFRFHSWRLFIAVSAVPSLLGVLLYWFLPESPRYLLEVGKEKAAVEVLRTVYKLNHLRDKTAEYPVKSIQLGSDATGGNKGSSLDKVKQVFSRTAEMFNRKYLLRSLLFLVIYFTLSFGSYGVTLWYPTFVNQLNEQKDAELFQGFCSKEVSDINSTVLSTYCGCNDTAINNSVISDLVLNNWNINYANFTSVTFQRVNFTKTSFNNTNFFSSSFIDCSFVDSGFFNVSFDDSEIKNLELVNSKICETEIRNFSSNNVLKIQNSTINSEVWNTTIDGVTFRDLLTLDVNDSICNKDGLVSVCPLKQDDFRVYRDSFFVSAAALPGNLASIVAVYFLIRKYWLAFSLFVSTISVFLLYVVHNEAVVVVMLCLFAALSTPAWNDSTLIVAEVYPTHLRTTAAGIHLVAARIGAIAGTNIFGEFVRVNPSIPILMVVVMLIIGGLAALPLPKTTRKTLLK